MEEFVGKVAVVTGAASGIGFGLAQRCRDEGMKVVLADVETEALAHAVEQLGGEAEGLLAMRVDVSKEDDVAQLAQRALEQFGAVHLLCNNAGVGMKGPLWHNTSADWQWALGVNLWGVIHGIQAFVPTMLAQDEPGHIVNTASIAGLISPGMHSGIYCATKHAVVALSEGLRRDLANENAQVGVSVLCPGSVETRISTSERNRPGGTTVHEPVVKPDKEKKRSGSSERMLSPANMADAVFDAVRASVFYILPHWERTPAIRARMENILHDSIAPPQ